MHPHFTPALALVAVAALAATPLRANTDPLVERFELTARADGPQHAVGVEWLLAEGERVVPLCNERRASDDVRERQLARYLLLEIREPEKTKRWRDVLNTPGIDLGVQAVEGDPPRARFVRWRDKTELLVVGQEAAPFFDGVLRRGGLRGLGTDRTVRALAAVATLDCAPTLIRRLDGYGDSITDERRGPAADGLRRLGAAALPVLRGFLDADPRCGWAPDWGNQRVRTIAVARLVADAGDREAIGPLRRAFARSEPWLGARLAGALARLGADEAAPELFAAYARGIEESLADSRRTDDHHLLVRRALVALGAPAVEAARKHAAKSESLAVQCLAEGIAYEVEHPKDAHAWYEAVGRAHLRRDRFPGRDEDLARTGRARFDYGGDLPAWGPAPPEPLAAERAVVHGSLRDVVTLLDAAPDRGAAIARLLAGSAEPRDAVPLIFALADRRRAEALDAAEAFLGRARLRHGQAIVEAVLTLGGPRAAAVVERLRAVVKDTPRHDRGETAIAVALADGFSAAGDDMHAALRHDDPRVCLLAARVLARRDDPAGVSLLVTDALADEDLRWRGGTWPSRELVLALGDAALPRLDEVARGEGEAARAAAGLALRLRDPALARRLDEALDSAANVFSYHVVREHDVVAAARRLASQIDERALPLVDEAALLRRARLAELAAVIMRGGEPVADDGLDEPPPVPKLDAATAVARVAEGKEADNIAAGRLRRDLGGAPAAAEALLALVRAAPDVRAKWNALRVLGQIVWVYPGRKHDPEGALAAAREEALAALLEVIESGDDSVAAWAAELSIRRHVAAPPEEVVARLVRRLDEGGEVPVPLLGWLATQGVEDAALRLLVKYEQERMGNRRIAKLLGQVRYAPASKAMWRAADAWSEQRPGYWTRIAELDALARIGGPENVARLVELYRSDALTNVRLQAADCLAVAGDRTVFDELEAELRELVHAEVEREAGPGRLRGGDELITVYRPALALLRMDVAAGAPVVYGLVLRTANERVRGSLLAAIATYRRENPDFTPPASGD